MYNRKGHLRCACARERERQKETGRERDTICNRVYDREIIGCVIGWDTSRARLRVRERQKETARERDLVWGGYQ